MERLAAITILWINKDNKDYGNMIRNLIERKFCTKEIRKLEFLKFLRWLLLIKTKF